MLKDQQYKESIKSRPQQREDTEYVICRVQKIVKAETNCLVDYHSLWRHIFFFFLNQEAESEVTLGKEMLDC